MSSVIISKMSKEDLQGVYEVEKNSFPIPWSIASFEEELNNPLATFLVAKLDYAVSVNNIVGFIGMWFVMDECHIGNVAVLDEYRGMGIATQLVDELFNLCDERKVTYIMLEVRVTNLAAQNLYKKFGFKNEFVRKDYYKNPDGSREDAIIMSLERKII